MAKLNKEKLDCSVLICKQYSYHSFISRTHRVSNCLYYLL